MKLEIDQKLDTQKKQLQRKQKLTQLGLNCQHTGVLMFLKSAVFVACLATLPLYAGGESGGGGDATEVRVNEIRADILKWINDGGAKGLNFSKNLTYNEYVERMSEILAPQYVVIGFTDKEVTVDGVPKTCRSYVTEKPYMLCNIDRFKSITSSEQYQLIHHEYAGLAKVEENVDGASDYSLTKQMTDYLIPTTDMKLNLRKIFYLGPTESPMVFKGTDHRGKSCFLKIHYSNFNGMVISTSVTKKTFLSFSQCQKGTTLNTDINELSKTEVNQELNVLERVFSVELDKNMLPSSYYLYDRHTMPLGLLYPVQKACTGLVKI